MHDGVPTQKPDATHWLLPFVEIREDSWTKPLLVIGCSCLRVLCELPLRGRRARKYVWFRPKPFGMTMSHTKPQGHQGIEVGFFSFHCVLVSSCETRPGLLARTDDRAVWIADRESATPKEAAVFAV